jgi:hypothetical protein
VAEKSRPHRLSRESGGKADTMSVFSVKQAAANQHQRAEARQGKADTMSVFSVKQAAAREYPRPLA